MAVPTASGRDFAIALRAQPPTFSGSGRNEPLGVWGADVSGDSYERVDCRKETFPLRTGAHCCTSKVTWVLCCGRGTDKTYLDFCSG